jgi:Fe-S-cluster containining protein
LELRVNPNPATHWLAAARDLIVAAELEAIYQMIADQIEARGPACWASGRCCHFENAGHRLYVTGLEAAYTAVKLGRELRAEEIAAATARGDCPFLSRNLCTVHLIKPLGCRVYFCDRSAQDWQRELSERALELVRRLHDRHGIPYRYGEWRAMLEWVGAGAQRDI